MNEIRYSLEGKLIAYFHQSADLYGSDRILLDLIEATRLAGGNIVVMLPNEGPLTMELKRQGIEFHILPILKLSRARFSVRGLISLFKESFSTIRECDQVFAHRCVDLVHSNTLAVLGGALWAIRRRIPHLWHVHEIIGHPRVAAKGFPHLLHLLADRVVCNSQATCQWLLSVQPRLRNKTRVVLNGIKPPVHVDRDVVARLHETFRPNGKQLAIGLVGRINRLKGHGLLLDAVDGLHNQGIKNFSVVFVGSPPPGQEIFLEQLRKRIAESPANERIVIQDFMPDIWPVYEALDIVCVPSIEPESFGLVAAEAMAMGKPVVVSSLGALGELVDDGITGMTFSPINVEAFSLQLQKLLVDSEFRRQLGVAGKQKIENDILFSVKYMTDCCIAIYLEILKTP